MSRHRKLARRLQPRLKPPKPVPRPDPPYPDEPYPSYGAYLLSDQWVFLRQQAMRLAHGICQRCLYNRARNAHHSEYPHDWRNDRVGNLIAVCNPCHKALHDRAAPDAWRNAGAETDNPHR